MNVPAAIVLAAARLARAGLDADGGFEARVLVEEALGVEPGRLYSFEGRRLDPRAQARLEWGVACRAAGVPLQYVVGEWEFAGMRVGLARGVLIPRPETEGLLEELLRELPMSVTGRAVDFGTGTGVLALGLARARPGLAVEAWDVAPEAVRLARRNARRLRLDVGVRLADFTVEPLPERGFAAIVSNPPYIASADLLTLDGSVRDHEPHLALDGGPDGLALVRVVIARGAQALAPGGVLGVEIGFDQGERTLALARDAGASQSRIARDLAGHDRVLIARFRGG